MPIRGSQRLSEAFAWQPLTPSAFLSPIAPSITQRIIDVFQSHGLDASKYSLFCHDEWEDKYEEREVVDVEAVVDDEGNIVEPAMSHIERKLVHPAGSRFGVRYDEALVLECAHQIWLGEQRYTRISELERRLAESGK